MSPDKVAPEPAATDHSIVIINNTISSPTANNNNNSNSSNGSSSGASNGSSSSRSPLPPSDRNNNIHHNHNNNSVTGSAVSQSNAILNLTPQSVIQPNQQSVIISTTAAGAAAAAVQLKHVLVNSKHHQGSVIQSTCDSDVQLISSRNIEIDKVGTILEDESKKRREVLERRPSYRKILNDLSSAEVSQIVSQFQQPQHQDSIKHDPDHHPSHHQQHSPNNTSVVTTGHNSSGQQSAAHQQQATITVASSPYLKVVPASTIQLAGPGAGSPADGLPGISALAVNQGSASAAGTIVQYHGQDGQFFVPVSAHYANGGHSFNSPVTVSAADLHTYQLGRGAGGPNSQQLTSGVMMTSPNMTGHVPGEGQEVSKKRELRLLKNREAAKECRRKKKEYIKCLENRVAVLENQNKALIDELKSLKELYCSNKND